MDENDSQETESLDDRLTGLAKTEYQIAQLRKKRQRQLAAQKKTERDADNRECQLLGILTKRYFMPRDPALKDRYLKAADEFFSRDWERDVFGLPRRTEKPRRKSSSGPANDQAGTLKDDFADKQKSG